MKQTYHLARLNLTPKHFSGRPKEKGREKRSARDLRVHLQIQYSTVFEHYKITCIEINETKQQYKIPICLEQEL